MINARVLIWGARGGPAAVQTAALVGAARAHAADVVVAREMSGKARGMFSVAMRAAGGGWDAHEVTWCAHTPGMVVAWREREFWLRGTDATSRTAGLCLGRQGGPALLWIVMSVAPEAC